MDFHNNSMRHSTDLLGKLLNFHKTWEIIKTDIKPSGNGSKGEQQVKKLLFKKTYRNVVRKVTVYGADVKTAPINRLSKRDFTLDCWSQEHRLPCHHHCPNSSSLSEGRRGHQCFSSGPWLPMMRLSSGQECSRNWELLSSTLSPLEKRRLYLGHSTLRSLPSWLSLPWFMTQWFSAKRGNPKGPQASATPSSHFHLTSNS